MDKDQEFGKTAPEQKLFIGGHWLEGQEWFEVTDKLTGDVLASVPICEEELFEMALQSAHDAVQLLSEFPAQERSRGLIAWAQVLESQRSAILPLLHRESAVPVIWADEEIRQALATLHAASVEAVRLPKGATSEAPGALSLSQPVGTVAVVLPERYAFFHAALLSGVAIAAGCPVILLAHPLAPLSVVKLVESALSAGFPAGTVNLLYGVDRDLGQKLAADSRVSLLAGAGPLRHREVLAATRGLRPQVHLGFGHGCVILDRGTDVPAAVSALLTRRFRSPLWGHAAPVFVLSHESLTSRLHESLGAAVMSLSGGRPTDMSTVVPWQLSEQAAQSAVDWLAVMKESGGSVFCGGRRTSTYVEPAVVTAPAGTRALPSPPPEAPFFVIDSYDKHPRAQLERFPELTAALVFSPDARRGVQLARLADVSRVEVFSPRPATAGSSPGGADPSGVDLSDLIADMTRRKRVDMVYTA